MAAGIGGGVVAGAVVVVLLLGGSAWWFSQRGPESPPPRREPINALPSPEAEQAPVEAATPDRVPAPVPPTQEAAPETLPETVPTEPELPEEEAEESVEPDVAEPEPSAADTGPLWANRVLTSPWAPEEARGPEETPPEAGSTPDPELEPVAVEMGYLAVTSQTKGLEVIVDGKVLARTPDMLVQVPLGYQMVTVRDPMTGNTDTKSITVSKTQQNLLTFDL